jgi:hypothetical protein
VYGVLFKTKCLRTGVSMAMCLLCTRAKESLPLPIKDRFVECGSPSITVQPHICMGHTWIHTHCLSTAIHLEAGCNRRQEPTRDLVESVIWLGTGDAHVPCY